VSPNKTYIKEYPEDFYHLFIFLKDNLPHQATFISAGLGLIGGCTKRIKSYEIVLLFISICKYNVSYLHVNLTMTTFISMVSAHFRANKKVIDAEKGSVSQPLSLCQRFRRCFKKT
jgi:hypothetical protein